MTRVAVVHDWLTGMRGGERVLESILAVFEDADVYTLLHVPGSVSPAIEAHRIHSSYVASLPGSRRHYRNYLPLFPSAIERFDLSGYDLVISSSHCVAKGANTGSVPHLCYCHTPMRYIWDLYDEYFAPGRAGLLTRAVMPAIATRLRAWDRASAQRVTRFVANSHHVRDRISSTYNRDADVIYPPVDVHRFQSSLQRDDAYVIAGALVPYKRADLAIAAFNTLGMPLTVVGDGPEYRRLRAMANGNITFAGRVSDDEVARLLGRARGVIMPMIEDFGIVTVEALASGTPVIAFAAGGLLETVSDATGVFFKRQTVVALMNAVRQREAMSFDPKVLRASVMRFAPERFETELREAVALMLSGAECASYR